ncbi:MAG: hypothetical protein RL685_3907 [Pseudomonadota bacterium]
MTVTGHQIELQNLEAVVDGGVRRVSWHVAEDERWLAAAGYPGARVEFAEGRPGVVWRRRVQLCLPTGSRLMRVESRPQRGGPKDPLAYLWRAPKSSSEQVVRSYFRVGGAGQLERSAPEAR